MQVTQRTIITATDDNYVLPLITMIYSAKKNALNDFYVVIGYIEGDLSAKSQKLLNSVTAAMGIQMNFDKIAVDEIMRPSAHISRTAFARLYMLEKLKGKVLWLDPDIICLERWEDIYYFVNDKMDDFLLAGIRDPIVSNLGFQSRSLNRAVISMKQDYFNSGVLFLNCGLWNYFELPQGWRNAAENYDEFGFQFVDQCILNYVAKNSYILLPDRFNRIAMVTRGKNPENTRLLHYAGPSKPWDYSKYGLKKWLSILSRQDINLYLNYQDEVFKLIKESNNGSFQELRKIMIGLRMKKNILHILKERISLERNLATQI